MVQELVLQEGFQARIRPSTPEDNSRKVNLNVRDSAAGPGKHTGPKEKSMYVIVIIIFNQAYFKPAILSIRGTGTISCCIQKVKGQKSTPDDPARKTIEART